MKNYYSTIDDVVLTFSDIEEDRDGFDFITFRFERPNDNEMCIRDRHASMRSSWPLSGTFMVNETGKCRKT